MGTGLSLSLNIGLGPKRFNPLTSGVGLVAAFDSAITPATATGWTDISGAGNSLTGANVVVNSTGGPNNGPYASSTGTAHLTKAFTLVQPEEIWFLANSNWVTSGAAQCICDGGSVLGAAVQYAPTGSNGFGVNCGANQLWGSNPLPASTWRIYNIQVNGAASHIIISGSDSGAGNPGTNGMGGLTLFVAGNGATDPLTGGIAKFYLFNQLQSGAFRTAMNAFLTSAGGT